MEARKPVALPIAKHGHPSYPGPATPGPAEVPSTASGVPCPSGGQHETQLPSQLPAPDTPSDQPIGRMGEEQGDAGEKQPRQQQQPPQHHQYQQQEQRLHQYQYQQQQRQQYPQQQQKPEGHVGDMDCSLPLPDSRQWPIMSLWEDPEDQALAEDCDGFFSEDDSTDSTDVACACDGGDGEGEGDGGEGGGRGETQPGSSCDGGRSDFQIDTCDSLPEDPPAYEGAARAATEAAGTDSGATAPAGGRAVRQGPRNAATAEDQRQASDDGGGAGTGSSYVVGGGGAGGGSRGEGGGGGRNAGDGGGTTSSRADGRAGGPVHQDGADGAGDGSHSRGSSFAPPPAVVRGSGFQLTGALNPTAAQRSEGRRHEGAEVGAEAEGGISGDSASLSPVKQPGRGGGGGQAGPSLTGQRRRSCSGDGTQLQHLVKRRCLVPAPGVERPPPDGSCHGGAGAVVFVDPAGHQQHLQQRRPAAAVAAVSAAAAGFGAALVYKQRNASQGSATSGGPACCGGAVAPVPTPAPPGGDRVRLDPYAPRPAPPPPAQNPSLPHRHHPHRGVSLPHSLAPLESPRTPAGATHPGSQTPTPCSSSWKPTLPGGALHPADLGLMACGPPSTHCSDSFFHYGLSSAGAPGCGGVGARVFPESQTAPVSPGTTVAMVVSVAPSMVGHPVGQRSHFCRCPACCSGGVGMGYNSAGSSAGSGYAGQAASSLGALGCFGVARDGSAGSGGSAGFVVDGAVPGMPVQGRLCDSEPAPPGFAARWVDGQPRTGCPTVPAVQAVRHGFSGPDVSRQCQLPPGSVLTRAIIGTTAGSTAIPLTPSDSVPAGVVHAVHAPSAAGQTRAPAVAAAPPPPLRYPMPPGHAPGRPPPPATLYGSAGGMVQCACALCVNRTREQKQQQWPSSPSSSSSLLPPPSTGGAAPCAGNAMLRQPAAPTAAASAAAAATATVPEAVVRAPRWTTTPAGNVSLTGVPSVLPRQPASAQPPGYLGSPPGRQVTTGHLHLQPSQLLPSRSGHQPCSVVPSGQTRDDFHPQQRAQEECAQEQQQPQQGHPPQGERRQQQQQSGALGLLAPLKPSDCSLGTAVAGKPETLQLPASYSTANARAASATATTAHTSSPRVVAGFPALPQSIQIGSGWGVVSEGGSGIATQPGARGVSHGTPSVSAHAPRQPRSEPSAPGQRPPPQPIDAHHRRYSDGAVGCRPPPAAVLVMPRQAVIRTLSTGRELLRQYDTCNNSTARVEVHRPSAMSSLSGSSGPFRAGGASSGGCPAPYSVPNGVVQSPAVSRNPNQAVLCGSGSLVKAASAPSAAMTGLYGSLHGVWDSGKNPSSGSPGRPGYARLPTFSVAAAAAAAAATAGCSYPSFGAPEYGTAVEPVHGTGRGSGGSSGSGRGGCSCAAFVFPPQTAVRTRSLPCGQGAAMVYPSRLAACGAAAATAPASTAVQLAAASPLSAARPCDCPGCKAAFLPIKPPPPPLRP